MPGAAWCPRRALGAPWNGAGGGPWQPCPVSLLCQARASPTPACSCLCGAPRDNEGSFYILKSWKNHSSISCRGMRGKSNLCRERSALSVRRSDGLSLLRDPPGPREAQRRRCSGHRGARSAHPAPGDAGKYHTAGRRTCARTRGWIHCGRGMRQHTTSGVCRPGRGRLEVQVPGFRLAEPRPTLQFGEWTADGRLTLPSLPPSLPAGPFAFTDLKTISAVSEDWNGLNRRSPRGLSLTRLCSRQHRRNNSKRASVPRPSRPTSLPWTRPRLPRAPPLSSVCLSGHLGDGDPDSTRGTQRVQCGAWSVGLPAEHPRARLRAADGSQR